MLGTRGRSGEQMDIFMAVYGPVGTDGYPKLLYDKWTGVIDKASSSTGASTTTCATSSSATGRRSGPKLVGKMHIYMGDKDTYYLEEADLHAAGVPREHEGSVLRGLLRHRRARSRTATRARRSFRDNAPSSRYIQG